MIDCKFSTVRERDMDLFFLEMIASDPEFLQLIVDKTDLIGQKPSIKRIELSHTENDLGESDITVVLDFNSVLYGFLLEDKVDAIAMPDQHLRYHKRGEKGIKDGEYSDYRIFILCPEKYIETNAEAKLYEHCVTYEECAAYLKVKEDLLSSIRYQQVDQAIVRAKRPSQVTLNEAANLFFRNYKEYQKTHYPELDLRTKESSNGWWAHYGTRFGSVYIYHKMQEGFVDLTFPNAATKLDVLENMASWLREHGIVNVSKEKTGNAAALRIIVPKLNVKEDFLYTSNEDLQKCFRALIEMHRLTEMLESASSICNLKKE